MSRCRPCESAPATGAAAEGVGCITVTGAGTDADPFEIALGSSCLPLIACTSTTRPSSPAEGQEIFETDTGRVRVWNGSIWKLVNPIASDTEQLGTGSGGSFSPSLTPGYPGPFGVVNLAITEPFGSGDPFVALVSAGFSALVETPIPSDDAWDIWIESASVEHDRGRHTSVPNGGFQAELGPVLLVSSDGSDISVDLKVEGFVGVTSTLNWTGDSRFTHIRAQCFAL